MMIAAVWMVAGNAVSADLPDVRIGVTQDGMHYVSASEIAFVLGVPDQDVWTNIAVGNMELRNCGTQVAYKTVSPQQGFIFYGTKSAGNYSIENAYMLKWTAGTQMTNIPGAPPAPAEITTFPETVHSESNEFTALMYFSDTDADYWFWKSYQTNVPGQVSNKFNFEIRDVNTGMPAKVSIALFSATKTGDANEHHAKAKLNGNVIAEMWWEDIGAATLAADISGDSLIDGTNILEISGILDPDISASTFYLDSFDVSYKRKSQALDDSIVLKGLIAADAGVTGFSTSSIYVADISDPAMPAFLDGVSIDQTGGAYRVSFSPAGSNFTYLAFAVDACLMANSISAVSGTDLKTSSNSAEYVIITADPLAVAAGNLAAYRESKNISTKVVFVDDIYNGFNNGMVHPQAIKDFINCAITNWAKPPIYIVLAGQGTYDYRNNEGLNECIVPPMLVNTPQGMYESDGWFTDINNDLIPDVSIGRLPAMTDSELQDMVDRIIVYESNPTEAWLDKVIFLADDNDDGGEFDKSNDKISGKLPARIQKNKIYLTGSNFTESKDNLTNSINNGAFILNYFGHSGQWTLSDEGLLTSGDIPFLTNSNRPVIVVSLSCQMGRFAMPRVDCLAEDLVISRTGGAVAVISPSGMAYNNTSEVLADSLYSGIFDGSERIIGKALLNAQAAFAGTDSKYMALMYNLMGDPGLLLRGVSYPTDDPYAPVISEMEQWKAACFTASELDDPLISGDYADPDHDKMPNLMEYSLGSNPMVFEDLSVVKLSTEKPDIVTPYDAILEFKRQKNSFGLEYGLMVNTNLSSAWQDGAGDVVGTLIKDDGNGQSDTVWFFVKSSFLDNKYYMKLKVKKSQTR